LGRSAEIAWISRILSRKGVGRGRSERRITAVNIPRFVYVPRKWRLIWWPIACFGVVAVG
jgi:hypothetical protein